MADVFGPEPAPSAKFPRLGPRGGGASRGPVFSKGWDAGVLFRPLPGRCRVGGAKVRVKYDAKPKGGADGEDPTLHGLVGQEFELKVIVWTDEQLKTLDEICRDVVPRPGQKPEDRKVLYFDHPSVRSIGISSVLVLGASQYSPSSEYTFGQEMTFYLRHSLSAGKKKVTKTPRNAPVRNKVAEKAGLQNPDPSHQVDAMGPKG